MKLNHPILAFVLTLIVLALSSEAFAASLDTTKVLTDPGSTSGISGGLTEVLRWTFLFLKFLAIVAAAFGSYKLYEGQLSSGVWAYVAALALFFSPAIVDLAQSIGKSSSSTNATASVTQGTP